MLAYIQEHLEGFIFVTGIVVLVLLVVFAARPNRD